MARARQYRHDEQTIDALRRAHADMVSAEADARKLHDCGQDASAYIATCQAIRERIEKHIRHFGPGAMNA